MSEGKYIKTDLHWPRVAKLVGISLALCAFVGCNKNYDQTGTAKGQPIVGPFRAKDENPLLQQTKDQSTERQVVLLSVYRIKINNQS